MKILLIHPECDPACVGWNLYKAINKYTDHEARHVTAWKTTIKGDEPMIDDIDLMPGANCDEDQLRAEISSADILHFSQYDWTHTIFGTHRYLHLMKDFKGGIVFHGHGGCWLLDPQKQIEACKSINAQMVTCSPIDEIVVPGIKWVPNILEVENEHLKPDWSRDFNGTLHASLSNKHPLYKGGEIVSYVFEYLAKFGYDIQFETIHDLPRNESFRHRQKHHITVDNWTQGFNGMSGFEGLALGHISFARLDPMAVKRWKKEFGSLPPLENIRGMDETAKIIRAYYNDRDMIIDRCKSNRKWIEEYYTEEEIVKKWIALYESLPVQIFSKISKGKTYQFDTAIDVCNALTGDEPDAKVAPPLLQPVLMAGVEQLPLPMYPKGAKTICFDFSDVPIDDIATVIHQSDGHAYVIGIIPVDGKPSVYEILSRTDRKLHRFQKGALEGNSNISLVSLEPR